MSVLLSFIIPCYRSENTINLVVSEIIETVREKPQYDYEIICVNDFSPDDLYKNLKELSSSNPNIKIINFAKNMGKHAAILAGYHYAKGKIIINLDDDFQCPINELWRLIAPLEQEDYDISTAKYLLKKQSIWKKIGSYFYYLTTSFIYNKPKSLRFENFSAMKRFVMSEIINYKNPYPNLDGLVFRITHNISQVEMHLRDRADNNVTGFTFFRNISLWMSSVTSFSIKPLRISNFIGILFALIGFSYGLFIIIKKIIIGPEMPTGFPSILASILFSSGIIMILLGIIGEYVGRIYISINSAPQFIIKNTINIDDEK